MKKNKISWLFSLISILLIIAAVVGMVVMVDKIGDEFFVVEEDGGLGDEVSSGGSNSGTSSGNHNSENIQNDGRVTYYINESTNTGYCVIGDTTYFFKRIKPEWKVLEYVDSKDAVECTMVFVMSDGFSGYSKYVVDVRCSYDLKRWSFIDYRNTDFEDGSKYDWLPTSEETPLYICYTSIKNCNPPTQDEENYSF